MIPDKQYFKIGEVAKIVGVKTSVLRFWETEFGSIRTEKSKSNQRLYTRKTVEHILVIRDLLYEQGFTIAGARRRLKSGADEQPVTMAGVPRSVLDRIQKEVRELLRIVED